MKTLEAYSNSTTIKNRYVKQMQAHIKADDLIRGQYVQSTNNHWQGCAVSCILNDRKTDKNDVKYAHGQFETEPIQFPEWLGMLIDHLHEYTSSIEFSQKFNVRLLKAIPPGFKNWQQVQWKFLRFVLESCKKHNPEPVQIVIDLFDRAIAGDMPSDSEWSAARSAARSAAWSAAESAAWSAARSAAWSAAWSAARSAAWSAAESAAEDSYANYLCELFEQEGAI